MKSLRANRIFAKSHGISPKILTNYNGQSRNFIVEKPVNTTKGWTLISPIIGQINLLCLLVWCTEKTQHHFCGIPPKEVLPYSDHKETSDKLKLRDFLQKQPNQKQTNKQKPLATTVFKMSVSWNTKKKRRNCSI